MWFFDPVVFDRAAGYDFPGDKCRVVSDLNISPESKPLICSVCSQTPLPFAFDDKPIGLMLAG
jgi:hypothetical protein